MSINEGDKVSIRRGKHAGVEATAVSVAKDDIAVKLPDGSLTVVKETNVRPPVEPTIRQSELVAIVRELISGGADSETMDGLITKLDGYLSGFREAADF